MTDALCNFGFWWFLVVFMTAMLWTLGCSWRAVRMVRRRYSRYRAWQIHNLFH